MDLEEIRALLAVAEHGSFVSAARATSLTRSTLRRRIDELEARIGAPLLDRSARGAELTPTGAIVVREGRLVAEHARAMLGAARTAVGDDARRLVLVSQQGIPAELTALFLAFLESHLRSTCLEVEYSANPRASLVEDADLVIGIFHEAPVGAWQAIEIRAMDEVLLASERYVAAHGRPTSLADLGAHRLAVFRGAGRDGRCLPLRSGGNYEIEPAIVTSDMHLLHTLASHGTHLAYAPDATIGEHLPMQQPLVRVLPELVGRRTAAWLLAPDEAMKSPRIRAFLDVVRMLLRPKP